MPAEPPWTRTGSMAARLFGSRARRAGRGKDSMRYHDPTDETRTARTERIPLWILVAAFVGGLLLLGMLRPAGAHAQTAADSTVVLHWTAPGDDGTTGPATSYDVRYSTTAITSSNWSTATQASGEPTPGAAGTIQNFTISGLAGSRTYYVAVRAMDEVGNIAALSNVVNGTTLDNIAPAAVRDLSYYGPLPAGDVLASSGIELGR